VCIGVDPTEIDRPWPGKERYVWLLPSRNVDQRTLPPNTWYGDLNNGMETLMQSLDARPFDGRADAARIRAAVRSKLESAVPARTHGMSPLRVLDALAEVWPAVDIVCCDVGRISC
jgi:thiamine pyrophosphate-dependent acetolactate synthase large subunit-like protein